MRYIHTLSDSTSARSLTVTWESFLAVSPRELSVAQLQNHGYEYRACVQLLAKAAGRQVLSGADTPLLD
jgi:hypothetical protein